LPKKRDKKCEFNCEARSCAFVYFEQKHKQNKQKRIRKTMIFLINKKERNLNKKKEKNHM